MRPGRGAKVPGRAREGRGSAGGRGHEAGASVQGYGGIRTEEGVKKAAGGKRRVVHFW